MPGISQTQTGSRLSQAWRFEVGDYPTACALTTAGDAVVVGTSGGQLIAIDTTTGVQQWRREAHMGGVLSVHCSAHAIASSGQDGHARTFSRSGDPLHALPGHARWVERIAWSPDGSKLAAASGKHVRIWSAEGAPLLETQAHASTVTALQWGRTGSQLATTCYGGVYLWDVAAHTNPRFLPFKGSLISLAWSPDNMVVACGSQDCSVHFWRLTSGRDSEMSGYPFKPKALAWDANSSLLATGGDATVCVWKFSGKGPEGTAPLQLTSHKGQVTALAFHPRRSMLASLAQDMGLIIWDPRVGSGPIAFAFTEDTPEGLLWKGDQVITTDASGAVVAWNLQR